MAPAVPRFHAAMALYGRQPVPGRLNGFEKPPQLVPVLVVGVVVGAGVGVGVGVGAGGVSTFESEPAMNTGGADVERHVST